MTASSARPQSFRWSCWRPLWIALLLVCAAAPPVPSQQADSGGVAVDTAAEARRSGLSVRRAVVADAVLLGKSGVHALTAPLRWNVDDVRILGLAIGTVAAVSLLDEAGRDLMTRSQSGTGDLLEELVEPFGRERGLQLLGGLYLGGVVLRDDHLRAVAAEGAASGVVAAALIQPALAELTGRPRPRKNLPAHTFRPFSGNISFPSGHTTAAFSVASVIATEYPHPAVQVASYGVASAVGLARMYRGAHFVSDVVAAAMLGTAVGQSVARFGRDHRDRLRVTPVFDDEETYLVINVAVP